MPNMLQSNPSDAADALVQPDWNSKYGVGVAVPAGRNASREFDDIYDTQRAGAKQRHGDTLPAPTATSISPATGTASGGTVTTITGNNLLGTTGVTFGGTAGTALVVNADNKLTVTAPAHASGAVSVVVTTSHGAVTKTTFYTYT